MSEQADRAESGSGDTSSVFMGSARNALQARDIGGGVHFYTGGTGVEATRPRQLPASTAAFTGRGDELAHMFALAGAQTGSAPGVMVIFAITGMAGIGKTALAVHAGHHLAGKFPDGQLFIDLHGFTQGRAPRDPGDVLAEVLRAYGVSPWQIPADLDGRAALYRDRLAGTRTLIILDNAATEAQVRPLLPGSGGCMVVVTSRRRLKALDDARVLPLDVLPLADAIGLFCEVAELEEVSASKQVVSEIAESCGQLPLAVRIAAALIRNRPSWTLRYLARRLSEARPALSEFADTDRDLTKIFDLSYRALDPAQQQLFRSLGLMPGPDVDGYAAAALLNVGLSEAERLLGELVDHSLLAEPATGRYRMHDLIRLHARTLADGDLADHRDAATGRMLAYYRHTTQRADVLVARFGRPEPFDPAPAVAPTLPDPAAALAWLRAERANLLACIELVADREWSGQVASLGIGLASLLYIDGPWTQALAMYTSILVVTERFDDQPGSAAALIEIGIVRRLAGDLPGAVCDLEKALELYRNLGDQLGQANVLTRLGNVRYLTGDLLRAGRDLEKALELYRDLGDQRGRANSLSELGIVRRLAGDLSGAAQALEEVLELYQDLGVRSGRANALTRLGNVRRLAGDLPGAAQALEEALEFFRETGSRGGEAWALIHYAAVLAASGDLSVALELYRDALRLTREVQQPDNEAYALEGIGDCLLRGGDTADGAMHLRHSLEIFQRLGMLPNAERVRARLIGLGAT